MITSINTESNNTFAAGVAVPHGAMLSNHGGSPSKLSDVIADERWTSTDKFGNSVGFNLFINAPANGDALIQLPNDNFSLLANVPGVVLGAYNIQGGNNTPQTVINKDITIGSIVNTLNNNTTSVFISQDSVLTFTDVGAVADDNGFTAAVNDYTALGVVQFQSVNANLTITPNGGGTITIPNAITTIAHNAGGVTTHGNVLFNSNIEVAGTELTGIDFNAGTINLNSDSHSVTFVVRTGANVTATDLMTCSNIFYFGSGNVIANGVATGNINFLGNPGIFTLGNNQTFTGTINTTARGPAGKLNFLGAGIVTGAIGATFPLLEVNFNGPGNININAASAITFTIGDGGLTANVAGSLAGNLNYNTVGTVNVADNLMGNTDFAGNNSILNLTGTIFGDVDNTVNVPAGTINFLNTTRGYYRCYWGY